MGLDPHLYLYDLRRQFPVDDEHAHQNMGNANFLKYLYKHSEWIKGLFTYEISLAGGTLDEAHSFGDGKDALFSRADLKTFLAELQNVPRPDDEEVFLAWNYDHLLRLVMAALSKPYLTLSRAEL